MASGSKVTPTLNPDTSSYDESDDDDDDNEAFLHEMGIVYCNTSLFVDQIKTLVGCFILGELKTFAKYCACVLSCVISCECMCMILCVCVCELCGMILISEFPTLVH
jgi:hypothetical protein